MLLTRLTVEDFEDLLLHAASERPKRQEEINGEFAWVSYERKVMMDAVNEERAAAGQPPVSVEDFKRRAENQALGHSDYAHKFALYCWELANERVPS